MLLAQLVDALPSLQEGTGDSQSTTCPSAQPSLVPRTGDKHPNIPIHTQSDGGNPPTKQHNGRKKGSEKKGSEIFKEKVGMFFL